MSQSMFLTSSVLKSVLSLRLDRTIHTRAPMLKGVMHCRGLHGGRMPRSWRLWTLGDDRVGPTSLPPYTLGKARIGAASRVSCCRVTHLK